MNGPTSNGSTPNADAMDQRETLHVATRVHYEAMAAEAKRDRTLHVGNECHGDVHRVMEPIRQLSAVCGWNGPSYAALAELIWPRTAADCTVRELLELMEQVPSE